MAERPQPVAHGEGAGVVHDLLHPVAFNEVADLVHDVDRIARAVGRVERRPAAERALRMPAVAAAHDVGARRLRQAVLPCSPLFFAPLLLLYFSFTFA